MFGSIPLFMLFSDGTTHDQEPMDYFLDKIKILSLKFEEFNLDTGYDKFELFAKIWHYFGAKVNIAIRENAVINKNGTIKGIDKVINKHWKEGINKRMPINKKLNFLYDKGKVKQVGAFFRNSVLQNGLGFSYKFRGHQERIHANIKKTVKFDVRYVHNKNKKLHTLWSFISYQLFCLISMQNKLKLNKFEFLL